MNMETVPAADLAADLAAEAASVLAAPPRFTFPEGIPGFRECTEFELADAGAGLYWLRSTRHAAIAFVLVDPFVFVDGYAVELDPGPGDPIGPVVDAADVAVLAIATLPSGPGGSCTINLQAPIVLNFRSRRGRQVVFTSSTFGLRWPVELPEGEPGGEAAVGASSAA